MRLQELARRRDSCTSEAEDQVRSLEMRFGNKLALAAFAAVSWVAGVAGPAQAAITFFDNRASFNAAAGSLTSENFSNLAAGVASGTDKFFFVNPLNSTNEPVVPGFSLVAAPAPPGGNATGFLLLNNDFGIPGI